eukprot:SAG31_NODE_47139_length_251_cov_1.026316_1_plen_36_part_10
MASLCTSLLAALALELLPLALLVGAAHYPDNGDGTY